MPSDTPVVLDGAVEGLVDEAVLTRLAEYTGLLLGTVYGKQGKKPLLARLQGYNGGAAFKPWCVLVDLNADPRCPADVLREWLPSPAQLMRLRIVVREIEAWLFGDRERLAAFLSVPLRRVPEMQERVANPKEAMVALARQSRRKEIREDMAPRPGSGRTVGAGYTSRLIEFVNHPQLAWRPEVAANSVDSLRRCIDRLQELKGH